MTAFVTAGAGFLLAVLWFDLMFDVQARRSGTEPLGEPVLASIAAYYARVTTRARPMNRLVATVMLATLAASAHTVPAAVRLGTRADDTERQSALARAILRDHVICFAGIAALLALQLGFA
jgi:hypothetical protein